MIGEGEPYGIDFYNDLMGSLHVEITKEAGDKIYITNVAANDFSFGNENETLTFTFKESYTETVYHPINAGFIPYDNETITLNDDGKLEAVSSPHNAATSLYLKDANDQVYEITVGTDGKLTATAVSNS